MHPELEDFLEQALEPIKPTGAGIGRVVIEPDYDVAPDPGDAGHVARELADCLSPQKLSAAESEVPMDRGYTVLNKYVRRITLHAGETEGPWIEVAPPGNWI